MRTDFNETAQSAEARIALSRAFTKIRARALPWVRKRHDVEVTEAYRAIFGDAEGNITAAGRIVIDDLAAVAGIGKAAAGLEHEELSVLEGKRRLWLHMMGRFQLSNAQIDDFLKKQKEDRL